MVHDITSQMVVNGCIVRVCMSTTPQQSIKESLQRAFGEVLELPWNEIDPIIRKSQNVEHGDFQANGAMALGKRAGKNPRELAEVVLERVDFGGAC